MQSLALELLSELSSAQYGSSRKLHVVSEKWKAISDDYFSLMFIHSIGDCHVYKDYRKSFEKTTLSHYCGNHYHWIWSVHGL